MGSTAFDLIKNGIMQSAPVGPTIFAEQGVVANGTQGLDLGSKFSVDSPDAIIFFSGVVSDIGAQQRFIHWGTSAAAPSWIKVDASAGDSSISVQVLGYTDLGIFGNVTVTGVAEGRIHVVYTTKVVDSDILIQLAVWDGTNGWKVKSKTIAGASTITFNTDGGNVNLLQNVNGAQRVSGTIFRLSAWIGSTLDVTDAAALDRLVAAGNIVDPAVSISEYGTPEFDCYGDAATWDSGALPVGTFTTTGNFTDA